MPQLGQHGVTDVEPAAEEPAERPVPAVRLLERRAQVGGALLENGPQQLGVPHDPGLDQVKPELGVTGAVQVVGQHVVAQHEFARHAQGGQHNGGQPAGSVLAARAVVEQRQPAGRADEPQRSAERQSLPRVGHERAVQLGHERGGPTVAKFGALPFVVTAGDELVDRLEVTAADGQVRAFDPAG